MTGFNAIYCVMVLFFCAFSVFLSINIDGISHSL